MPSGTFKENATSGKVVAAGEVHISLNGTFGGGTVAVEKFIRGELFPLFNEGVAVTFTAPDDSDYLLKPGDAVQITLTGSTAPNLTWSITQ